MQAPIPAQFRLTLPRLLNVMSILDKPFRQLRVDQAQLREEYGMLIDDRMIALIGALVHSFSNSLNPTLRAGMSSMDFLSSKIKYATAVIDDPDHINYKRFTQLAISLLINLYIYGNDFFAIPFENPQILNDFAMFRNDNLLQQTNGAVERCFARPEVDKQSYYFAITGKRHLHGYPEFSLTKNSNHLRQFFARQALFTSHLLEQYPNLVVLTRSFRQFYLNHPRNPFFNLISEPENLKFFIVLFGEWGESLPDDKKRENCKVRPFVEFLNNFEENVSDQEKEALVGFIAVIDELPLKDVHAELCEYLRQNTESLKWFLKEIIVLNKLAACYRAYKQQLDFVDSHGKSIEWGNRFFMQRPWTREMTESEIHDLNVGSDDEDINRSFLRGM